MVSAGSRRGEPAPIVYRSEAARILEPVPRGIRRSTGQPSGVTQNSTWGRRMRRISNLTGFGQDAQGGPRMTTWMARSTTMVLALGLTLIAGQANDAGAAGGKPDL